jgi:hypothetical protein
MRSCLILAWSFGELISGESLNIPWRNNLVEMEPTYYRKDDTNQYLKPNHPDVRGVELRQFISPVHVRRLLHCSPYCEKAESDCKAPCKTCKLKVIYSDRL